MKHVFITFLAFLIVFCSFGQNQKKIDSLENLVIKTPVKERTTVYLSLADETLYNNPQLSLNYAKTALEYAQKYDGYEIQSKAYGYIAAAYYYLNEIDLCIKNDLLALENAKKSQNNELIARTYNNLFLDYLSKGDIPKILSYGKHAIQKYKKINNYKQMGNVYAQIGIVYTQIGNNDTALKYFDSSFAEAEKIKDTTILFMVLNSYGMTYQNIAMYDQSIDYYFKALQLCKENSNTPNHMNLGVVLTNIATVYSDWGMLDTALTYHEKALEIYYETETNHGISIALNNIGEIYMKKGNIDKSLDFFQKSLLLKEKLNNEVRIANTLINIAEAYIKKKDYVEALKQLERTYELYKKNEEKYGETSALLQIGNVYSKLNKSEKSKDAYLSALEISSEFGFLDMKKDACYGLYELYKNSGNLKEALKYHEDYMIIKDSIFTQKSQQQIANYAIKYNLEQKDREIKLQQLELANQEITVKQKIVQRNVFIAAFIVIAMLAFVVFYRYRIKKKISQTLSLQNEEIKNQHNKIIMQRNNLAELNRDLLIQKEEITNQKNLLDEAIQNLEISNSELEKLSLVAREVNNSVVICDNNGKIEWVNQGFENLHQKNKDNFIKEHGDTLVKVHSDFDTKKKILAGIQNKEPVVYEYPINYSSNKVKWVQATLTPILHEENGDLSKVIVIESDISQLKKIEKEAVTAKRSQEVNQTKAEFLANMSHEIRTPLNAIVGFAKLLEKENAADKQQEYIKTIQNSAQSLLKIINDILELSKIETIGADIIRTPINIYNFSRDVIKVFFIEAQQKKIELIVEIDEDLPANLFLDEVRLRQVLFNLMGNAVKFTKQGFVKIKVSYKPHSNSTKNVALSISVIDTGIGIPKAKQKDIFEAFEKYQSNNNKQGGLGLGLTISMKLVHAMAGHISIQSEEGKGSIFTIHLPKVKISGDLLTISEVPKNIDHITAIKDSLVSSDVHEVKTKDFISNDVVNELKKIDKKQIAQYIDALKGTFFEEYKLLKKTSKMNQIKAFANHLNDFANDNSLGLIKNYSDLLLEHAEEFNIRDVKKLINSYELLIRTMETNT